jgi:hypothetical protein
MKEIILSALITSAFFSCQDKESKTEAVDQNASEILKKEALKFADIIGDILRYDVGEPVLDIVFSSDTTLYWKSLNPKLGTEANEKITVLLISEHQNMVSYLEKGNVGVCWFNDFENEIATVSVFVEPDLMTFSGSVKRKYKKE